MFKKILHLMVRHNPMVYIFWTSNGTKQSKCIYFLIFTAFYCRPFDPQPNSKIPLRCNPSGCYIVPTCLEQGSDP